MKIPFLLRICYPENIVEVKKEFTARTRKGCFKLAEKWMDNYLTIYGKDEKNRKCLDAEIKSLDKE